MIANNQAMKKAPLLVACLTVLLFMTGCNEIESSDHRFGYSTDCIRGIIYYKGGSSMAPAYKKDGALYTC
jgi:hypothetical protein